ncbi:hypothetical protein CHS0354_027631 [Potamilus streckersoni]|uniref:Uncharacterized protein n=1 Tax=Potamilus streckersoni TaxID=2493646 RepID=A0AAE0W5Y7_9BIVA|nr:hypothetical protein CHS0354_027631 [Potamilus streckersoni]
MDNVAFTTSGVVAMFDMSVMSSTEMRLITLPEGFAMRMAQLGTHSKFSFGILLIHIFSVVFVCRDVCTRSSLALSVPSYTLKALTDILYFATSPRMQYGHILKARLVDVSFNVDAGGIDRPN